MASNPTICVKALVDKGSNKIIFVESGNDLVDTIFSYLTIPMGTVIELARKHSDPVEGFLRGPAIFRVTDILVVRLISPILEISVLQELPFTDIEDHTVYVGKREISCPSGFPYESSATQITSTDSSSYPTSLIPQSQTGVASFGGLIYR